MDKATSMPRMKTGWMRSGRKRRRTSPGERPPTGLRAERVVARGQTSYLLLASSPTGPVGDQLELVKRLRPDKAHRSTARRRFAQEVRVASRVSGPGLLDARRIKNSTGDIALVMPWLDGPDLLAFLVECERRGRRPRLLAILPIALRLGEALAALHRGGNGLAPMAHGAVNAGNVVLSSEGGCWLVDYGHTVPLTDGPRPAQADLRALGELLATLRAGTLPDSQRSTGGPPPHESEDLGRQFDRLAARCLVPPEQGGFASADDYLAALGGMLDTSTLRQAVPALVQELELLFGTPRAGGGYRTGLFRPPLLPMVVSWLPPVPRSAAVDGATDRPAEPPAADVETAEFKKARPASDAGDEPAPKASPPPVAPRAERPWRRLEPAPVPAEARATDEMTPSGMLKVGPSRPQAGYEPTLPGRRARPQRATRLVWIAMLFITLVAVGGYVVVHVGLRAASERAATPEPAPAAVTVTEEAPVEASPEPVAAKPSATGPSVSPAVVEPERDPLVQLSERRSRAPKAAASPAAEPRVRSSASPRTPPRPSAAPARTVAAQPEPRPAAEPAAEPPVRAAAPADDRFALTIASSPPGASIAVGDRRLGTAPVVILAAPGDLVRVTAELPGYTSSTRFHKMGEADQTWEIKLRQD